jgi:hypothetical protein
MSLFDVVVVGLDIVRIHKMIIITIAVCNRDLSIDKHLHACEETTNHLCLVSFFIYKCSEKNKKEEYRYSRMCMTFNINQEEREKEKKKI